jgi:hypothetical protein
VQRTSVTAAAGVGCGGAGSFVEGVVSNQPGMSLNNAKQRHSQQKKLATKQSHVNREKISFSVILIIG